MRQSFLISLIFFVCFPCISDISGTQNAYARRTDVISNLDLKDSTTALHHHIWPEREGMRKVVKLYQLLDRIIPQYGYIDSSGKEIVPCKFLYATDFENGYDETQPGYNNENWNAEEVGNNMEEIFDQNSEDQSVDMTDYEYEDEDLNGEEQNEEQPEQEVYNEDMFSLENQDQESEEENYDNLQF